MTHRTEMSFRLAIRKEGPYLRAYLAEPSTMKGSFEIASIAVGIVTTAPDGFDRWKQLLLDGMKQFLSDHLATAEIEFTEHPAPECERSGHG